MSALTQDRPAASETQEASVEPGGRLRPERGPRVSLVRRLVVWASLLAVTVVFAYPLVWLVSASLKPRSQVFDNRLVPRTIEWDNYRLLFETVPMATWFLNSLLIGVLAAVAVTASSSLTAFAFAYFRFPGRGVLFTCVLATMMLPVAVTMVPQYVIWTELGFGNTQVPLWAQNLFGSAFYIFLLRQFFLGLPRDTFEAARIDGAGFGRLFAQIALPQCRPALIVVLIFELRASWTDLIKPLIYLQDSELFTIPRGLKTVLDAYGQGGEAKWEIVMGASVLATVPLVVLFFLAQRHFVEGIATQGRKG